MQVLTCEQLVSELSEVLSRKKISKYLTLPISEYTDFHLSLTSKQLIFSSYTQSPDPKDNFLFDLAIQHKAEYIVTGDKKLLDLKSVENVRLISLSDFKLLFYI